MLGQAEAGAEVLLDHLVLASSENGIINRFLELLAEFGGLDLRQVFCEELLRFLGLLAFGKSIVSDIGNDLRDALNVDLGAGRKSVGLIDAFNWHTIQLEGASNAEKSRLQLLQEHNSLAAESSSKQNEDSAGLD